MASVTLTEAWFHVAADNSHIIRVFLTGASESNESPGGVRPYASGRRRWIGRTGHERTLSLEFKLADRSDADQLRTWQEAQTELMYRDPRGRKLWGHLADLPVEELAGVEDDVVDLACTFVTVSHVEAV